MTSHKPLPPVACTLTSDALDRRMCWISELRRDALLDHERRDLVLRLRFAASAAERVRTWTLLESQCCAFLTLQVTDGDADIVLTISAPETTRHVADRLFEAFVGAERSGTRAVCR